MMTSARAKRRAFTLFEILCVMTLLVLAAGMASVLLIQMLNLGRAQTEYADQFRQTSALADQFRADAAQAESAPKEWQQYQADRHTLILQLKGNGHVVYVWREGNLLRRTFDGEKAAERAFPYGGSRGVELVRDSPDGKVVRLRLLTLRDGKSAPGETLEFAATLGGN